MAVSRRQIAAAEAEQVQAARNTARPKREYFQFESSWVDEGWYTETGRLVEIRYHGGHHHLFFDVEPATWKRFTGAGSPGRFVREILERHVHRAK